MKFKYFFFLLNLIIFLSTTTTALGLKPVLNSKLDKVTGQAGMSFIPDDINNYKAYGKISYRDLDGGDNSNNPFGNDLTQDSGAAALNLENLELDIIRINAIAPGKKLGEKSAKFDLSDSDAVDDFEASPMTIDVVDELPALSPGFNYMFNAKYGLLPLKNNETYNQAGVVIGLPTINVFADEINVGDITVTALDRTAKNDGESFGSIQIKDFNMSILSGLIEISPYQYSGVQIAADDIRIYQHIEQLRYTDSGGLPDVDNDGASLVVSDVEADVLRINALTHTNANLFNIPVAGDTIVIKSPGKYPAHLTDENGETKVDNYYRIVMLRSDIEDEWARVDLLASWHGQPLMLNVTRHLPDTTKIHQENGGSGVVGGIWVGMPVFEMHYDSLSIGGISIDDHSNQAINDGASFFPVEDTGSTTAILNGGMEISTH